MSGPIATIKCFTIKLDKVIKGKPVPVTMSCVYSTNGGTSGGMGIGYVLAVDNTVTEIRCFNLGLQGQQAFMNTDKQTIVTNSGSVISFRLGFSDKSGQLSAFMMQGPNGDDIIESGGSEDVLAAAQAT